MPRKRTALNGEAFFEGVGIHSGAASSVRIAPCEEGGIVFGFGARRYGVTEAYADGSGRNTSLVFPGGERVRTVEHLLSAIAGTCLDGVLIEPEGEELPIMDGSPLPFAEAIMSLGLRELEDELAAPPLGIPLCVKFGESSIAALPSEELRITYVIDYPGSVIGTEMKDVTLTRERFMSEIAPARTFCLAEEAEALRKAGFGLGGGGDNVLVVGEGVFYRVERECAAHKAADLLGDLALAGFVPRAHYICVRGGHSLHLKLADRIKRSAAATAAN